MHRFQLWGTALAAALVLTTGPAEGASAPAASAPVLGVVVDTAGAPLANALVVAAGAKRSATTGSDGSFSLGSLPTGRYHLEATLLGYAPAHEDVTVAAAGGEVRVRIVMTPTPLSLEGVVVTGTPGASSSLASPQSTVQVSGKELDRSLGSTVAATLARQPGITTRYNGPAAATPVIRGLTGERVLILENGERTGDLSGASADHALSVDPLEATRLEVVRGPESLTYGSNALGGVVNVLGNDIPTTVPGRTTGYAALQGESASPGGALSGSATLRLAERLAATAQGGARNVGDVRIGGPGTLENTYFQNAHGNVGIGYVGEAFTGGIAGSAYVFDYGLPSAPDAGEAGVHIRGRRLETKGRGDWTLGGSRLRDVHAAASAQRYSHDEVESSGAVGTNFLLSTETAEVRGATGFFNVRGALGASALLKQYQPTGQEALTPSANSSGVGAFLFEELPLGRGDEDARLPRLQLGARYDVYRITSGESEKPEFGSPRSLDFGAFSGSLGLNVPVSGALSVSGSLARAFRAPTVEELFSNGYHAAVGSFDRGDAELSAETNVGAELVLHAESPRLHALASAYLNRIADYIAPRILGDTLVEVDGTELAVPLSVYAQQDASIRGVEGRVEGVLLPHVVLGVKGDALRGRFDNGAPLPYMPAGRVGGLLRWDDGPLTAGGEVTHAFAQTRVGPNEATTGAYTLLDLSATYTISRSGLAHTLTLGVDNLLDQRYREATSRVKAFAPNPGRNVSLVYRVLF